jgi:spore coat polysaccharide biosynthesis protein SpsF (cytidylyltransferase family)/sialic acid synthase SpsE/glycosyltransferase involved in cell wall biosynthesis
MKKSINIIAEIANAHQGNPKNAVKLARAAVESGANSIKFQIYFVRELLTRNHPRFSHFREQAFTLEDWDRLLPEVKKLGVEVYADVFGLDALDLAKKHHLDGVKVHSSDLINSKLLDQIAYFQGKVFLAVGGSSLMEIRYALDHVTKFNRPSEIILMHGFQAYPTKIEDSKLKRLSHLSELFSDVLSIGYMDHVDADSSFSMILPLLSIPYGVQYLEKHITFDRAAKGIDYYSSLEPKEFQQFVDFVDLAVISVGDNSLEFSVSEKKYRDTVKKSWVLGCDKVAGEVITDDDLIMKRAVESVSPPFFEEIVGREIIQTLKEEDTINKDCVRQKVLAVIVARSQSSRLPGKAMASLAGEPAVAHLLRRVLRAKDAGSVDSIAFCTTKEASDDALAEFVSDFPVNIYRGEVEDVLSRMMLAVNDFNDHDVVLRITGDDVLIDAFYLAETVKHHLSTNAHYTDAKGLPSGTEVEVFDATALQLILELSKDSSGTEYLTNYIVDNLDQFKTSSLPVPERHNLNYRLTIDTSEDFSLVSSMLDYFKSIGKHYSYSMDDIVEFMESNQRLASINKNITQRTKPISIDSGFYWGDYTARPMVTIYITNHNYGQYIRQAIESILSQNFTAYELLIIDDGSSDESHEIIEEYRRNLKVKIVYQKNKGLNATNNIALNLARGKYIMRLDADDYLHKSALLLMTNRLEKDSDLAMVFPDYYTVDKDGQMISHEYRHDFSNDVTLYDQPAHGACSMVRKSVLNDIGGYSEEFKCQDGYELWIKVTEKYSVSNINLPLFYYRQHGNNLTNSDSRILKTRCDIIRKHSKNRQDNELINWCVIPIRADSESSPLALKLMKGKTLLDITLEQVVAASTVHHVIVTTNDKRIYDYVMNIAPDNVIIDMRPDSISSLNVAIEDTIQYLLEKYTSRLKRPEIIAIVNYEYPLRDPKYIDKLIDVISLFNADSSLSVTKRTGNLYKHEGGGLVKFSTNRELRLERESIYEDCGGLHAVKTDVFEKTRSLIGDKATHVLLDKISSKKIDSILDLEIAEFLYQHNINNA